MSVINTNVKALVAQNSLNINNRNMSNTMEQLSTGKRINSAADDAAGLAIASKMTAQIKGLNQAVRNANDSVSLIQTAEGALNEVDNMLQRMRQLSVQSANDTNTTSDRAALNDEFVSLREEINRIASNTQFNGTNILDKSFEDGTGKFTFQVGANSTQTIDIDIQNFNTQHNFVTNVVTTAGSEEIAEVPEEKDEDDNVTTPGSAKVDAVPHVVTSTFTGTFAEDDVVSMKLGDDTITYTVKKDDDVSKVVAGLAGETTTDFTLEVKDNALVITGKADGTTFTPETTVTSKRDAAGLAMINGNDITTRLKADAAIVSLDTALAFVSENRADMGATINRLTYAADNLTNVSLNASASRSRIEDTDYALATTELARSQIIQQAATAMLAQANQQPSAVLSLLQ